MHHEVRIAGETLYLLPERALFWPATRTLLVADAHFGKAATFRARGVPVPHGTTAENLARLSALLLAWEPVELIFLGDLLHARHAHGASLVAALTRWRARHAALRMTLVLGNHDRHAGAPPREWGVEVVEEPYTVGPFGLRHYPLASEPGYTLAGHLHPAARLSGRGYDSARLPCFWFGARVGVLPAFGAFTGSATIEPEPGDAVFLAAPGRVLRLPNHADAPLRRRGGARPTPRRT